MNHEAGSLPQLVENLVKNWEVEASFKPNLSDWRTIDHANYTFAINGGPPQTGEHMLRVGTYNAIIAPNEYYSPLHSDFASSHKTFKRMMPTFAWEVLEVYSGPPKVAFRWRHWGVMKNDYVGFNDKGEKVMAKAHGGAIDIQGVTVASVDEKVRLQSVETWFDPLDMFRQIAPNGVVNKETVERKVGKELSDLMDEDEGAQKRTIPTMPLAADKLRENGIETAAGSACPFAVGAQETQLEHRNGAHATSNGLESHRTEVAEPQSRVAEPQATRDTSEADGAALGDAASKEPPSKTPDTRTTGSSFDGATLNEPTSIYSSSVTGHLELSARSGSAAEQISEAETRKLDQTPYPHPHDMEEKVHPAPGEAVVVAEESRETKVTHEEMSAVTEGETESVMNVE